METTEIIAWCLVATLYAMGGMVSASLKNRNGDAETSDIICVACIWPVLCVIAVFAWLSGE